MRIFEAAQEFRLPAFFGGAARLATGRSMQIALLIEIAGKEGDTIASSTRCARFARCRRATGLSRGLCCLCNRANPERGNWKIWRAKSGAMACALFSHQLSAAHFAVLEKHEIPRVLIGNWKNAETSPNDLVVRVDHDNYRYAYDSVMWLHSQGHARIAWAAGPGDGNYGHTLELRRGYRDAIKEIGGTEQTLPHCESKISFNNLLSRRDYSAVIVRYLHGAFAWLHAARMNGLQSSDELTILAQMEAAQTAELYLSGFAQELALHLFDSRRAGEQAGEILMNWAAGQKPEQQLILVSPQAPHWGRDRS